MLNMLFWVKVGKQDWLKRGRVCVPTYPTMPTLTLNKQILR